MGDGRRAGAWVAGVVASVIGLTLMGPTSPAPAAPSVAPTYENSVSRDFADTFADPAVIRGKDGLWYAFGTSDPLHEGEGTAHRIPIARSADLVTWTYVGDAFTDTTLPRWAEPGAGLWAPDIRYVDGEYRMYFVVTETTVTSDRGDNAIGMATAPTPTGPWTASGAPVVAPRPGNGGYLWTFDPSAVTDTDGSQWLFYGSYNGGVHVRRLSDDGRSALGAETMVAIDNKFEGAYVIRRGGWWYLFASTANCCAGPTTGYSVHVGRSRDLRGPYVDRQGLPLVASRAGGTPVLTQNGNRWIGAGHNAVVTDVGGRDWIVYHALGREDPYLDGTDGINERPMLIDRLHWWRGWPTVRRGRGPSEGSRPAPDTRGHRTDRFESGLGGWTHGGSWSTTSDTTDAGRFARSGSAEATLTTTVPQTRRLRVEGDVRGPAGLVVRGMQGGPRVRAVVRPGAGVLEVRAGPGRTPVSTVALPAGFDGGRWHSLSLEVRGRRVVAELSHARLGDPFAVARLKVPTRSGRAGSAGAYALAAGADVDNLSVAAAARERRPLRNRVPDRLAPAASDEFTGPSLAPGWSWVREDPDTRLSGGALVWPTQAADLVGAGNDAAVLLRNPPRARSWAVETKLTTDLGTDTIRNYSQGGLVAYVGDDLFLRLSHVAIWNTRQTEFGKEMPYGGRLSFGGNIVGPPDTTTWLRLTHRVDRDNGEHELRAWTSRDGRTWVRGGVWTLPASAQVRVGLISHGGAGALSQFDYFRSYR